MSERITRRQAADALSGTVPGSYMHAVLATVVELQDDFDAVRAALGGGADEDAWPPGLTVAQAVLRLRSRATPEQVAALTAERDDLAAELAAARGEDIGEWECVGDFYAPRDVEGACPVVEQHVDGVRWIPVALDGNDGEVWRGEPTGVLAAMRAACEAARGFGWTP